MMTKRQCWRVVLNINYDLEPRHRERPVFLWADESQFFANSFDASIPPGYLVQGSRQELLQRVEALRDTLSKMSPDQLKVNEITEDDRRVQMSLYEKLSASLRAAK